MKIFQIAFFFSTLYACKTFDLSKEFEIATCNKIKKAFYNERMNLKRPKKLELPYKKWKFVDYCRETILRDDILGNGHKSQYLDHWRPSIGSALQASQLENSSLSMPYVKEVIFKNIENCSLTIRIFSETLEDFNKNEFKPLVLIHGGAWQYRGITNSIAVDPIIPFFTSKKYVVFSPHYRLLDRRSGPHECQGFSGKEIEKDIEDAFTWIESNKIHYGVKKEYKYVVAGHSAGAHLATLLSFSHPDKIKKSILFYPPIDFNFYIQAVKNNQFPEFSNNETIGLYLTGERIKPLEIKGNATEIARNSFSTRAKKEKNETQFFLIQGKKDTLVPYSAAIDFCKNLGSFQIHVSNLLDGEKYICGDKKSRLYLLDSAYHMMDIRCMGSYLEPIIPSPFLENVVCAVGKKEGISDLQKIWKNIIDQI